MTRWSVRWELTDAAMPAELARLREIFADDPEAPLESLARNKQRSHERRDQADWHIRTLKANPSVAVIRLYHTEKDFRWHSTWNRLEAEAAAKAKCDARKEAKAEAMVSRYSSPRNKRMPRVSAASIRRAQAAGDAAFSRIQNESPAMKYHLDVAEEHATSPISPDLFSFRHFQKDDMARAALHNGALLGWEPGLGKTMPAFTMPFLWRSRRTLITVQADLHQQLIDEGREKFGVTVRILDSQETALRYQREGILPYPGSEDHSPPPEAPEFFITAYNWLGYNGGDEWQQEEPNDLVRSRRFQFAARLLGIEGNFTVRNRPKGSRHGECPWEILGIPLDSALEKARTAYEELAHLWHPQIHPADREAAAAFASIHQAWWQISEKEVSTVPLDVRLQRAARKLAENSKLASVAGAVGDFEKGIGEEREGIRCVCAPTLSSIVSRVFDCVVCDEAVAIKSGTAYQADGVLRMQPRFRLALTGTPIKNKLPDLFFLCSWVTGHTGRPTARWPYGNTIADRAQFSADFGVLEENLTKAEAAEERGDSGRRFTKTDATQICNIHRLWRVLGPVLIRRRKDDVPGCDIVRKTVVPIHVMPGTDQKRVYGYHVMNPPVHDSMLASLGAQLQMLRQAALHPASPRIKQFDIPESCSTERFTPKVAGILALVTELLSTGEQAVIFSPFQEFSASLSRHFTEAGIPHLLLDGNISPQKRGKLIKQFKSGEMPVLIAGIKGMASGHNLDCCYHLILPGLEWALDLNRQAVDRVHRLTSKKDVTIYVIITKGTIDERLAAVWQEKGDSSDLALDGRLVQEAREKMDVATFLREAVADFDPDTKTLDEREMECRWHAAGAAAMRHAYATFRRLRPVKPLDGKPFRRRGREVPEVPPQRPSGPVEVPAPVPDRPRSLFDLMKERRQTAPASSLMPELPPAQTPAREALPLFRHRMGPPKTPAVRKPLRQS